MKIEHGEADLDIGSPFPEPPFLARHYSLTGALVIVSRTSRISPAKYSIMFLDGRSGPAQGDVWSVPFEKLAKEFIPIRNPVTFVNEWPRP